MHTKKNKTVTSNFKNAEQISSKNSFLSDKVKTPVFYLLLKIYKPNNPGRTGISSIDCQANRISEFNYHYLKPAVKDRKSDVQDKTDLTEK